MAVDGELPVDTLGAFVAPPAVLVRGADTGPSLGTTLVVKDVIDVAGVVTGAGVPEFAAAHDRRRECGGRDDARRCGRDGDRQDGHRPARLRPHAARRCRAGRRSTPRAPGHITGGSSAGSAAAVAGGLADLGLGTDTGGSIRVPASYCGIVGWRPTYGRVDARGIVHLARSFDTVGLLARDARRSRRAADCLLDDDTAPPITSATWVTELTDRVET